MGDFNVNPRQSKVLHHAMAAGLVHDIGADWAANRSEPQATFYRQGVYEGMQGKGTTRIDAILGNKAAAHLVSAVNYHWDHSMGYDHVRVSVTLSCQAFVQPMCIIGKPQPIYIEDITQSRWHQDAKTELWTAVWAKYVDEFDACEGDDMLEDCHLCRCRAATEYLCKLQSTNNSVDTRAALRGTLMSLKVRKLTTRFLQGINTAVNAQARVVSKTLNRCRELGRRMTSYFRNANSTDDSDNGDDGDAVQRFWNQANTDTTSLLATICKATSDCDVKAVVSDRPTPSDIESITEELEREQQQAATSSRRTLAQRVREDLKKATKR